MGGGVTHYYSLLPTPYPLLTTHYSLILVFNKCVFANSG
jgi:hypothetical protein